MERARTFNDTQIFKSNRNGKSTVSIEEVKFIENCIGKDIDYRIYNDKANGYTAFSFSKIDQRNNPEWADDLVDGLNTICECWGEESDWYVGDLDEEYVFVN